jgi:hypothetical protein
MKDRFGVDWSTTKGTFFWKQPQLTRRLFFRHAGAAVGGYWLLPSRPMETVARAAASPIGAAKNCIFVLLSGGQSHTDTFDLKEGSWLPSAFQPTDFNGVRFPRGAMPKIADHLDAVALVRSVKSWAAVHELARNWVQIGRNPIDSKSRIAPHIGSVVSLELRPQSNRPMLPSFLAMNSGNDMPGSGYLAPEHAPFQVSPGGGGLANTTHAGGPSVFDRRYDLLLKLEAEERGLGLHGAAANEMLEFNLDARKMMYNAQVDTAFRFAADERNRYGNTAFGNACIASRNLLQAGLGTRFIQITLGGWDNHQGIYAGPFNVGNANSLIRQFDNGLGTLIGDMKQSGLLEQTLIVVMGEFGRTTGALNAQAGRDHFLQQSVMFAGAGIRGPKVIGATDELGRQTIEPGWGRSRDIRAEDIEATIFSALGIDWTIVRRDDPLGRGYEYVPFAATEDRYGPLHELWS